MKLNEETAVYKDWDEFVRPNYILVYLNNGKQLKIAEKNIKGGKQAYQTILRAFNDNHYYFTNKLVNAMTKQIGESITLNEDYQKNSLIGIAKFLKFPLPKEIWGVVLINLTPKKLVKDIILGDPDECDDLSQNETVLAF